LSWTLDGHWKSFVEEVFELIFGLDAEAGELEIIMDVLLFQVYYGQTALSPEKYGG
jgi:hypothetical protein